MADLNEVDVNISATEEFSQGTVNFSVEIEDQKGDDYFEIVVYSQFDGPVLVETDSGFFYQRDSSVTQTTSRITFLKCTYLMIGFSVSQIFQSVFQQIFFMKRGILIQMPRSW